MDVIWEVLFCTFHDMPFLKDIELIHDTDGLFGFWKRQQGMYFIVNQVNALELGGHTQSLDDKKKDVIGWLDKMRSKHRYIFSASANEPSNQQADMKQSGTMVIRLNGGMSQVTPTPTHCSV